MLMVYGGYKKKIAGHKGQIRYGLLDDPELISTTSQLSKSCRTKGVRPIGRSGFQVEVWDGVTGGTLGIQVASTNAQGSVGKFSILLADQVILICKI